MKNIEKISIFVIIIILVAMNLNNTYKICKMTEENAQEDIRTKTIIMNNTQMIHDEAKRIRALIKDS